MAHGISEQMANVPKPQPQRRCLCGESYESHLGVDGKLQEEFKNHMPAGLPPQGINRDQRRQMGLKKRPTRMGTKGIFGSTR